MKLEERFVNYVRNAVDLTVGDTGYPVLAKTLADTNIATRKQLRQLVRKGHLIEVTLKHNNGRAGQGSIYKAYHTERHVPEWVSKQHEKLKEGASEK